ncbi:MAG TPA: cation diffusion facilitator family transporter [Xanthobacteraceae bacterium]
MRNHNHPGHVHAPRDFDTAFAIGIGLNVAFVALEFSYGWIGNSVALIADAGHNLSDVLGLAIAWAVSALARQPPSKHFTYGLRGSSILAALFNAMFLLTAVGAIAWEAILRFNRPEATSGRTVMIVAAIGIVINGATAWMFASGRKADLNIRGAFLHMAADAAVSAGVLLAGAAILLTARDWIDPVVSLVICAIIFWSTWGLLKDSVRMSLGAVPSGINPTEVRSYLESLSGVNELHDLHIWSMSTTETALTCHLVMPGGHPGDAFLMQTARELHCRFGIGHATVQTEISHEAACVLAPDEVV